MSLPTPIPGLVISYSYLWAREHGRGVEEGRKSRPCAIIAARQIIEGREVVTVVPITHSPPADLADAVAIPAALKAHLTVSAKVLAGQDGTRIARDSSASLG